MEGGWYCCNNVVCSFKCEFFVNRFQMYDWMGSIFHPSVEGYYDIKPRGGGDRVKMPHSVSECPIFSMITLYVNLSPGKYLPKQNNVTTSLTCVSLKTRLAKKCQHCELTQVSERLWSERRRHDDISDRISINISVLIKQEKEQNTRTFLFYEHNITHNIM